MSRIGQAERGFSLLEVMVAFAITTLALGILSQIFGQGSRNLDLSRDYTRALGIAENLIAEYGRPESADARTHSDAQDEFRWRVDISPYELPPPAADDDDPLAAAPLRDDIRLVRIAVEVDWDQYGKARKVALESLRIVTNGSDAS